MDINNDTLSKLHSYQKIHLDNLMYSITKYNRALDASDTGTGKTFTAIALCKILDLKPFIVCPKSVIKNWIDVCDQFNLVYYGISNYELIQNCKYYTQTTKNYKMKCPYITVTKKYIVKKGKTKEKDFFEWKFPKNVLVIFDEAHRCKNKKTKTSSVLISAGVKPEKILLLSATIADKPETFEVAGMVLGLYDSMKSAKYWIKSVGLMTGVHDKIFKELKIGSRMRIKNITDVFKPNEVKCECLNMETCKEIQEKYKMIEEVMNDLKSKEMVTKGLGLLVVLRQQVEMLKVPTFVKLAKQYIAEGNAVAIFVSFTATLRTIAEELGTTCMIFGEQTIEERNKNIEAFNTDKSSIIICNMRAGGVGISLHKGELPKISLIMPSYSAIDLLQCLGRIHRAGGKHPTKQKIIFCKDTIEESLCEVIKEKIENIAHINDAELESYKIQGLIDHVMGRDPERELSEFEKLFQRINVLYVKRDRLKIDLTETENELKTLEATLHGMI